MVSRGNDVMDIVVGEDEQDYISQPRRKTERKKAAATRNSEGYLPSPAPLRTRQNKTKQTQD